MAESAQAGFDLRADGVKVLTFVVPLFASSIAMIYDVGFFFGLDIGFFMFFTFSEHLVLAPSDSLRSSWCDRHCGLHSCKLVGIL
jgi:hypothetical protein